MLQCLSFLYLFSLPVGITLPAVPAVPRSLVAIIVAIIMFQQFCQLSTLCGKVSLGGISVGIQTNTLRPANLPLANSWCFKPAEPELIQNGLGCRQPQLPGQSCSCIAGLTQSQHTKLLSLAQKWAIVLRSSQVLSLGQHLVVACCSSLSDSIRCGNWSGLSGEGMWWQ